MTDQILLDPTAERSAAERPRASRPASLHGATVGLLDISKPRGDVFLARLDELLTGRGVTVRHYRKPTFTRPAPAELYQQLTRECDVVVEGLAD